MVRQRKLIALIVATGMISGIFIPFNTAEAFVVSIDFPDSTDDIITQSVGGQPFEVVIDVQAGELLDADSVTLILDAGASGRAAAFDSDGILTTGERIVKDNELIIDSTSSTALGYVYGMGLISYGYSFATGSFSSSGGFVGGNTLGTSDPSAPTTQLNGFIGPGQITISGTLRTVDLAAGSHTLDALIDTGGNGDNVDQLVAPTFDFTVEEDDSVVVAEEQVTAGEEEVEISTTDSDGDPIDIGLSFDAPTTTTGNVVVVVQSVDDFIDANTEAELEAQGLELVGSQLTFTTDDDDDTFIAVGFILDIDISALGLPDGTLVTLNMDYDDTGLSSSEENDVRLMHQLDTLDEWEALTNDDPTINGGDEVDTDLNIVYGSTDDFSLFGPAVLTQDDDDDDDDAPSGGGGGGGGSRTVTITWPEAVTLPADHFINFPLDRILVASSAFVNAGGVSIDAAVVGQQVSIAGEFTNQQPTEQTYAFIVQVTDEAGFVTDIAWQQGTLDSGSTADVSTLWTPENDGTFTVKIFVWNEISAGPEPLSEVTVKNIAVTG